RGRYCALPARLAFVSRMRKSTTACSASRPLAPAARASSYILICRCALVPRIRMVSRCSSSRRQPSSTASSRTSSISSLTNAGKPELPAREIEQLPIDAVAHGAPAVLGDQHVGVDAPAAILEPQAIEPPGERHDECGEACRIIDAGAAVHHPHLERRIVR